MKESRPIQATRTRFFSTCGMAPAAERGRGERAANAAQAADSGADAQRGSPAAPSAPSLPPALTCVRSGALGHAVGRIIRRLLQLLQPPRGGARQARLVGVKRLHLVACRARWGRGKQSVWRAGSREKAGGDGCMHACIGCSPTFSTLIHAHRPSNAPRYSSFTNAARSSAVPVSVPPEAVEAVAALASDSLSQLEASPPSLVPRSCWLRLRSAPGRSSRPDASPPRPSISPSRSCLCDVLG